MHQIARLEEEFVGNNTQRSPSQKRDEKVIVNPKRAHDVAAAHVWPNDAHGIREGALRANQNFTHTGSTTGEHRKSRRVRGIWTHERGMNLVANVWRHWNVFEHDDQLFELLGNKF